MTKITKGIAIPIKIDVLKKIPVIKIAKKYKNGIRKKYSWSAIIKYFRY